MEGDYASFEKGLEIHLITYYVTKDGVGSFQIETHNSGCTINFKMEINKYEYTLNFMANTMCILKIRNTINLMEKLMIKVN